MTTILITNDDGIGHPGILALEEAMRPLGKTFILAPDCDNSGTSHAITLRKPLQMTTHAENRCSISGTPVDCVVLGINQILPEPPALVVSGINPGPNLGDDVHYSGTVAAAVEAVMQGVPGIAFSLGERDNPDFAAALEPVREIVHQLLVKPLPPGNLLNVNIPVHNKGLRVTCQGRRRWQDALVEEKKGGETFFRIDGGSPSKETSIGSDIEAFNAGYIAATPIQLDLTNYQLLRTWRLNWEDSGRPS